MLAPGQPFFPYWVSALKLCNLYLALPYVWDGKGKKLTLLKNPWLRRFYSIGVFIPVFYLGVMFIHMGRNGGDMTLPQWCKGLVGILMFGLGNTSRLTFWIWKADGLKMLNGILEFEKDLYTGIFDIAIKSLDFSCQTLNCEYALFQNIPQM
jgi:hypothetical protein